MKRYQTDLDLPEVITDILNPINEVAHAKIDAARGKLIIEFELDDEQDEYDLATMVHELTETLNSDGHLGFEPFILDRPEPITDEEEGEGDESTDEQIASLTRFIEDRGIQTTDLDKSVYQQFQSRAEDEAMEINNGGLESQLRFLISALGVVELRKLLETVHI